MADRLHLIGMQCTASSRLSLPLISRQWLPIDEGRAVINMEGKNTWWDIGGQKSDQSSSRLPPIQFQTDGSSEAGWPLGEALFVWWTLKRSRSRKRAGCVVRRHVTPQGMRALSTLTERGCCWTRCSTGSDLWSTDPWTLLSSDHYLQSGCSWCSNGILYPQQIKLAMEAIPWQDRLESADWTGLNLLCSSESQGYLSILTGLNKDNEIQG